MKLPGFLLIFFPFSEFDEFQFRADENIGSHVNLMPIDDSYPWLCVG